MRLILFSAAFVAVQASLSSGSSADQIDDYLLVFEGACLRNMHDASLLEKMAEALNWRKVAKETAAVGAPLEGKLLGSWIVREGEASVIIATSEGNLENREIFSCAAISRISDPGAAVSRMQEIFNAKKMADEKEGFQRYQVFKVNISGNDMLVTALTGTHPSTAEVLNLTAQYPIPKFR